MKYFLCALTFLTRIPIPVKGIDQPEDFKKSIYFFPVVGLIIGGVLAGSYYLLAKIFPMPIVAALLLFIYVLLTGGLHLDGLIDTVDGIYGGRSREHRLEIMKDTHPGAFGVLGAVVILLIKYSIYTQLSSNLLVILIAASVMGRQAMVWVQIFYPYARKQGLGMLFNVYGSVPLFGVTTGITMVILFLLAQINGLYIFLICSIILFILASWLSHLLGGLTGDTYGASCELIEISALLTGLLLLG